MQQANYVAESLLVPESLNDRNSNSDCLSPCQSVPLRHLLTHNSDPRMQMFQSSKSVGEVSPKLVEKAITWIQSTGFTKNFAFETIVLSVSLFYASLNKVTVTKKNLQATLCATMLLASKMTTCGQISLPELRGLIENRQSAKNILEQQKKILEVLDYNIHFQFPLTEVISSELGCGQQQEKAQFLAQVLLIRQSSILTDGLKVQEIIEASESARLGSSSRLAAKVQKIIKRNGCQHLVSKYQAKFNVADYIIQTDHIQDYI